LNLVTYRLGSYLKVDVSRNQMAIRGISLMTRQTGL